MSNYYKDKYTEELEEVGRVGREHFLAALKRENALREKLGFAPAGEEGGFMDFNNKEDRALWEAAGFRLSPIATTETKDCQEGPSKPAKQGGIFRLLNRMKL
ncbi:MAG TPA: hypothetical protein VM577_07505 [Anaerovoracaceae bacterium]|nr:hypothetical protein [Anaerovoracaceae bacterium]